LGKRKSGWKLMIFTLISSIIPDADVIGYAFGIPYEHVMGHRGFTHSLLFALLWAAFVMIIFFRKQAKLAFFVLLGATLSHTFLDALTTGGLGVAFFSPFDNGRYFFPDAVRVIQVSPLGIKSFFSAEGLAVIRSEFLWIGVPCIVLMIMNRILLKR